MNSSQQNTRRIGKDKESSSIKYLKSRGYKFLDKNFTISGGEIDLIMRDSEFIVFIEVKSLHKNSSFSIYETLPPRKKRFLKRAINQWLLRNNCMDQTWRVDFIGITGDRIEHFKFIDLE